MKKIMWLVGLLAFLGVGFYGYNLVNKPDSSNLAVDQLVPPNRPAEVNGKIVSVEGNEIVIENEIDRIILTEAEQAAKKAEMQKLSEEERKAMREAETAENKTEKIILIIPVGIPVVAGSGDGSGQSVRAELDSLTKGTYVSVWLTQDRQVEYVKLKGI